MHKNNPDLMIWLGDNLYLREPDWNSKTGVYKRYTHSRSTKEMQAFLASTHHYAIWDDHDYGPNNSDRGFWNKNVTMQAFEDFWANPSYGIEDTKGAFTSFQYSDADFFLLDNRYYRSPNNLKDENKTILGDKQLQWLKDALVSSEATFKIIAIGGQFLTSVANHETYANYGFKAERDEIIDFIYSHNIKNVVFLSGDRHFTALSMLAEDGKPAIYDLTTSSLTAGSNTFGHKEDNIYRVDSTLVMQHNFSILKFTGTSQDRKIRIENYNSFSELNWDYIINAE